MSVRITSCWSWTQDGGDRVLEQDVVAGVALPEFVPNLAVEVVVGVLGFPQPARHAERVPNRAVRLVAAVGAQLRDEHQPLRVFSTVGRQAVHERQADVFLVGDSAELDELAELFVVAVDVRVSRHGPKSKRKPPRHFQKIERVRWPAHSNNRSDVAQNAN